MTEKVLKVTLRQFLDDHSLTAYQLAKEAGMAEQTVYSIVGERRQPSSESWNNILNALSRMVGRTVGIGEVYVFTPDAPTVKPKAATPEREA